MTSAETALAAMKAEISCLQASRRCMSACRSSIQLSETTAAYSPMGGGAAIFMTSTDRCASISSQRLAASFRSPDQAPSEPATVRSVLKAMILVPGYPTLVRKRYSCWSEDSLRCIKSSLGLLIPFKENERVIAHSLTATLERGT